MPLDMQPLSDKFGVAITGVDLSKELDDKLFNEVVDVFVKKQVLVFREAFRKLPSSPMRRSTVNSLAWSRLAISGIRTSHTDERHRSRLCSMPISHLSRVAIRNSPTCMASMKAYPMILKIASRGAWVSTSAASWAIHASR